MKSHFLAAEMAMVRTVICCVISGARMGLGDFGMAVLVVVNVASFQQNTGSG